MDVALEGLLRYLDLINQKERQMRLQVYEGIVLLHPRQYDQGTVLPPEERDEKSLVVIELQSVLATSLQQAQSILSTKIPKEYLDKMERIEVLARPF